MKKILLILLFIIPAGLYAQQAEVQQAFEDFKAAMMNANSDEVLKMASSSSLDYYNNMLDRILYADSATVAKLPLIQKIGVLGTRARVPVDTLIGMSGKDFLQFSLNSSKQNAQQMQMLSIGEVMKVDDNIAQGQLSANGQALPMSVNFIDEGGAWKIDMESLENMSEGQLQMMMSQSGMDFNQFLKFALSQQGITVDNSIWQPMAER